MARALTLLVPLLLVACTNRADEAKAVGELEARVEQLEGQVRALQRELSALNATSDAERVTAVARARTCALDLARTLEGYRRDNRRYPSIPNITLPDSCARLRVNWRTIEADRYAFDVKSRDGQVLARQASQ